MTQLHRSKTAFLFFTTISLLIALAATACAQTASTFTPIRPPAVPLITRSPYVSTWLDASNSAGSWPRFWNGNVKAITGMASIDGAPYLFLGAPNGGPPAMTQTSLQVTPTQSIYTYQGGDITLTVDFLSPVEASDQKRLSIPLSYITAQAQSSDGNSHTVSLYFDISGEWAHGDSNAQIIWNPETIPQSADGSTAPGSLMAWEITPTSPSVLSETADYPDWGTALLATSLRPGITFQSGQDSIVRGQFTSQGVLTGGNDTNYRAINNNYPVFAYSLNLGSVGAAATAPWTLVLGQVRDPAVSYQGQTVPPLWKSYFGSFQPMLAFSLNDYSGALARATALDSQVTTSATRVGGMHYAALCTLALRQAFAGTELVDPTQISPALSPALPDASPWLFLKEISSDGNVSTVDVAYPAFPAFLYTNPELVRLLIAPLVYYPESGKWPMAFAEHDIGASYPNANGHNDGGGENMPVEETANLLIMADAYTRFTPTPGNGAAYAKTHYKIFKQWADYLLTVPSGVTAPNALDPQFQNQTDDFSGPIAHSVNLSLKGIIAVGAMGQMAALTGNTSDASYYKAQAQTLIGEWAQMSQSPDASHLLLQYQEPANPYSMDTTGEPNTAWSLKYNAFPDRLLGTNLIPASVLSEEAAFDTTQEETYGIPLDYRNTYTKTDWELWTAGATNDSSLRQDIIDEIYSAFNTTPDRVPFTDFYEPATARHVGFQARPVIGGVFAPMFQFTAPPVFSLAGGIYLSPQSVTISEATPGAVIHYTVNGTVPTASSPIYAGPLLVSKSETLEAIAIPGGSVPSEIATATYTILSAPLIQNGSFERPSLGKAHSQYHPSGSLWNYSGDSGIQSNGSVWQAPPAPDGTQTAFLQATAKRVLPEPGGAGSISQSVTFSTTGVYTLSFQAASRAGLVQPLRFTVDGIQIGVLLLPPVSGFAPLTSAPFTVSAGHHTLALTASDVASDKTAFVDMVTLAPTGLPLPATKVSAKAGATQIKLTWTGGALATSYNLYRSTVSGGEGTVPIAAGIAGTTFIDNGLTSGTTYFYQVAAVNNYGVSSFSGEVSATPQLLLPTSEAAGYAWQYTFNTPPANWFATSFNDSGWTSGLAGFGTINGGGAVSRTPWTASPGDIWIRRHFTITGSVPANQQFRVFHDEDCEIYLNGTLAGSASGYVTGYVTLPMTSAGQSALKVGDNVIAVHCHQTYGGQYIDVGIQTAL